MALSTEDRKFIKMGLPHGIQTKIAKELGISRSSVNQYLSGTRNSDRIEKAVVEEFEKVKRERNDLRNRIYM